MSDPNLWLGFCGMFFLAAVINLARAGPRDNPRRPVRLALSVSCVLWGIGAYLFRFRNEAVGVGLAIAAAAVMLYSALLSARAGSQKGT